MLRFWFGLAAIGLMLDAPFAGAAAESVSGTLQIGAERFDLKYVFAAMEPVSLGSDAEKLTVFLSDAPVPDELRKATYHWTTWAQDQASDGKFHGVTLSIDPATGVWSGGLTMGDGTFIYTERVSSGESNGIRFTAAGPIGGRVAGKASKPKPEKPARYSNEDWGVEAEFSSAVVFRPAITGVLTGAAARKSPQYKAAKAFRAACRSKDDNAFRRAVTPKYWELVKDTIDKEPPEGSIIEPDFFPPLKVTRVTIRGDSAEVTLMDGKPKPRQREVHTVELVNGEWKEAD